MIKRLCRIGDARKVKIREIEDTCMKLDGTRHRMYLESDCNLDRFMKCFYIEEKNGVPRSVLSITNMEPGRAEISAFTDPDWRGRGLFRKLWEEAAQMLRERGIDTVSFVCEPESNSGKAVLKHLGAKVEKSEYLMELWETETCAAWNLFGEESECLAHRTNLEVRCANNQDIEDLAGLLVNGFRMSRSYAEERVWSQFAEGDTIWKVCEGETIVGMCVAAVEGDTAFLYDVCVARSRRGQGIGTRLVKAVIGELKMLGVVKVRLQVSSKSRAAMNLYRKLGFEERDRIDYYRVKCRN